MDQGSGNLGECGPGQVGNTSSPTEVPDENTIKHSTESSSESQNESSSQSSGNEPSAPPQGVQHVIKCGRAKTKIRLLELKQESTEPYDGNKDNQGGFQTGQYLWDSGLYLSRWVLDQRERFRGKRVIELGSGLGLPGLTAAKFAAETLLTDCTSDIVANLLETIRLNKLGGNSAKSANGKGSADNKSSGHCSAMLLDWTKLDAPSNGQAENRDFTFDAILASDCIYMVDMAPLVANIVATLLRPGGFAILVFPEGRPGVPEFLSLMRG